LHDEGKLTFFLQWPGFQWTRKVYYVCRWLRFFGRAEILKPPLRFLFGFLYVQGVVAFFQKGILNP